MKRLYPLLILVFLGIYSRSYSQKPLSGYGRWQVTTYVTYNGGFGVSLGRGMWIEREHYQPSFNLSVNGVFSKHNIANKNRAGSRFQFNAVITPLIIFGKCRNGYYETLNTFYFGNANAVISNFTNHFAIGSNFVVSPKTNKGLTDNPLNIQKLNTPNIYSNKNRAQQLIYLGVRVGGKAKEGGSWSFNFNLYEDHMIIPLLFSGFADHFDRFYTGGGNLGFNFYLPGLKSGPLKFVLYDDVYTGTFEREMFDSPDIYDLGEENFASNNTIKRRTGRFVAQEPGQKLFNVGRFFGFVEVPLANRTNGKLPLIRQPGQLRLMFGMEGGRAGMLAQDMIHDISTIDKINPKSVLDPLHPNQLLLYPRNKGHTKYFERLHHFYPVTRKGRIMWGGSFTLGPKKTNDLNPHP